MHQESQRRVVAITGASSGIGRASAIGFAGRGDDLVLIGRGEEGLEGVAAACREAGGQARVVVEDVTRPDGLENAVQATLERSGRIDVWVNAAGVGAVGPFESTPMAVHARVIETDLLGYMRGAHAVIPHFKARGRGVLINLLSVGSWTPAPYATSYSAAKFGLRGFTDALRGELGPWPAIHVCDVHPSFVDTPGLQHGANYVGVALKPPPGVVSPEAVARAVVRLAGHPRRQVVVGRGVTAMARIARTLAPQTTMAVMRRLFDAYFSIGRPAPVSAGNLFTASQGPALHGGWRRPGLRAAALAGGSAMVVGFLWLRRRRIRVRG